MYANIVQLSQWSVWVAITPACFMSELSAQWGWWVRFLNKSLFTFPRERQRKGEWQAEKWWPCYNGWQWLKRRKASKVTEGGGASCVTRCAASTVITQHCALTETQQKMQRTHTSTSLNGHVFTCFHYWLCPAVCGWQIDLYEFHSFKCALFRISRQDKTRTMNSESIPVALIIWSHAVKKKGRKMFANRTHSFKFKHSVYVWE